MGGFLSEPLLPLPSIIFPLQRLQPSATLGRPQMSQRKGAARDEMANQHGGFAASYPPSVGEQVQETRRGKQDALWVFLSFVINQLFLSVLTLKLWRSVSWCGLNVQDTQTNSVFALTVCVHVLAAFDELF